MKYQITIQSNEGYGSDQVKGITVGELKDILADYENDAEIVTYDINNERGACFGIIHAEIEECTDEN